MGNKNNKNQITSVRDLLEFSKEEYNCLDLHVLSEGSDLDRELKNADINRPGLSLFGFFDYFAYNRLQLFGMGEISYLKQLIEKKQFENLEKFFDYDIPACIFCRGYIPPETIRSLAEKNKIPVLYTSLSTSELVAKIQDFFHKALAPKEILHGVLMEIFGMGVLITGDSGVGKSECALELIERGHRFIADDIVNISLLENTYLIGSSSKVIAQHMEIRGIGVINIAHLFGVSSIRNDKKLDLIAELRQMNKKNKDDNVSSDPEFEDILGVKVPKLTIPIQPGTNIPILVETASINQRLKKFGYNPAEEFNKKLNALIDQNVDI